MSHSFAALLGALALLAAPCAAQTGARILGHARDTSGQPVAGARFVLEPGGRTTVSEANGRFVFMATIPGTYRLLGTRIGYAPTATPIVVETTPVEVQVVFDGIPRLLDSVRIRERASRLVAFRVIVVDDLGRPVPGADVEFFGDHAPERTDSSGFTRPVAVARGTAMVRVRKIGFAPTMSTVRILGERADTIRLGMLALSLAAAEILERSGFGRDTFVFRDLAARMKWRGALAGVFSRDELDAQGRTNLCDALPNTPTGAKLGLSVSCSMGPMSILIDGVRQSCTPLRSFFADQVEAIEYYPPRSDWSGSFAARVSGGCGGGSATNRSSRPARPSLQGAGFVIWMRPTKR